MERRKQLYIGELNKKQTYEFMSKSKSQNKVKF